MADTLLTIAIAFVLVLVISLMWYVLGIEYPDVVLCGFLAYTFARLLVLDHKVDSLLDD